VQERNLYFNVSLSFPIKLVIGPLKETWERTYRLADELIQRLPGRLRTLYFLGNSRSYPLTLPRDFRENAPSWFGENKNRVSLIRPILEENKDFKGMLIVVSSHAPVDLNDWQDTEIIKKTLFVRLSSESFGDDLNEVDAKLGTSRIMEAINNPATRIFIQGEGFVPIRWEIEPNTETEVSYTDGLFKLTISPPEERIEVHLKCLARKSPLLFIEREKGQIEGISGEMEHPFFDEPEWQEIPEEIRPVVEAGISKKNFACPQCGSLHRYDTLICPQGDLILRGLPTTYLLFTKEKYLPLSDRYAYLLKDGLSLITRDGSLYKLHDDGWKYIKKIEPYERVDDGLWALFHRI